MASERSSTKRRAVIAASSVGLLVLLVCWFVCRTRPWQMGADEEVLKSVDALFTAITARDEKLLGPCEQRLHGYQDAGKLPANASDYLDGIVQKARAGRWEPAAECLYDFMMAQRREGPQDHPKKKARGQPNSHTK